MLLLEKLAYHKLRKKVSQSDRRVIIPQKDSVKKIGVLWKPADAEALRFLRNHFSDGKIIFRNLCIFDKNQQAEAANNVITSNDLNWLGFPKSRSADEFINTKFDLLFNIILSQTFLSDYITALSKAHFKLGWSPDESNFFDLNINIQKEPDSMYLARQQIFYLGQFFQT